MLNTAFITGHGPRPCLGQRQSGVILLEALISIVIFSLAILGLIGLQAAAVKNTEDARQRAAAAFYANQILGYMWTDARAKLPDYAHNASGSQCGGFSGSPSFNPNVTSWIAAIDGKLNGLTSSTASSLQQIKVDTATNVVAVTLCWKNPQESAYHFFTTAAQIQG